MKLATPPEVHRSSNFKQQMFDIGDTRIILEILRSKMYSRPIYVIVQEIMSNSRDAHREVGTPDLPVEVILSTFQGNQISFKDYGPGISPDRMENVYLKYGNSTKRDDNTQTGGFGLGAKTPFAYTDSFNITTVTDKKRTYVAFIDETNKGAVSLVSEEDAEEPTGTTITLPVRDGDMEKFQEAVTIIGQFWNPRPKVISDRLVNWPAHQEQQSGIGWTYYKSPILGFHTMVALIDGVPYSVRQEALSSLSSNLSILTNNNKVLLKFDVGEIQVTANREDIDYQPEVIEAIGKRVADVFDGLVAKTQQHLDSFETLIEASKQRRDVEPVYTLFGMQPTWRGIPLLEERFLPKWKVTEIDKEEKQYKKEIVLFDVYSYLVRNYRLHENRPQQVQLPYKRYNSQGKWDRHIHIDGGSVVVEAEHVEKLSRSDLCRIRTLLDTYRTVTVISFINPKARSIVCDKFHFDKWGVIDLATVSETLNEKGKRSNYTVSRVKEWINNKWVPTDRTTADDVGGVYVLLENGNPKLTRKKMLSNSELNQLRDLLNVPVFGVLWKYSRGEYHPNWKPLFEVLKDRLRTLRNDPKVSKRLVLGQPGSELPSTHPKLPPEFHEYLKMCRNQAGVNELQELNSYYRILGRKELTYHPIPHLQVCGRLMRKKYPMIFQSVGSSKREMWNTLNYVREIWKKHGPTIRFEV